MVDFPRTDSAGADAGRRRCVGAQPGLSGGLHRRRGHQLELRRSRRMEWVVIRTSWLKQDSVQVVRLEARDALDLLRPREIRDLRAARRRSEERSNWWTGPARLRWDRAGAGVRAAGERRAVADEQDRAAAAGAFQQVERAGVGADDGAVRDAGDLLGPRVQPDHGRKLLHPAGSAGQVRMDGARGQGLPDRGGQSGAAEGRDLPGVLSDAAGGRRRRRACNRA